MGAADHRLGGRRVKPRLALLGAAEQLQDEDVRALLTDGLAMARHHDRDLSAVASTE